MKNLWIWFTGKKTIIGASLLLVSTIIQQLVIGVNHYEPAWIDALVLNLNYIGEAFAGIGLIHKAAK